MLIRPILSTAILIALFSCSKVTEESYVIDGIVRDSCQGSPVSGLELFFSEENSNNAWIQPVNSYIESAFTGADGHFFVELTTSDAGVIVIWYKQTGGYRAMQATKTGESANNLQLIMKQKTDLNIWLNVAKTYTNLDTLTFFNPATGETERYPGPFEPGLLKSEPYSYEVVESPPQVKFTYKVNQQKSITVPLNPCGATDIGLVID